MKILIASEDIRLQSGTSEILKNIVKYGSKEDVTFVHYAWAFNHPDKDTVVDLPEMRIYSVDTKDKKKDKKLLEVINIEEPHALFLMGDAWALKWIFRLDAEIRKYCPIVYYNVWDNFPTPYFNKGIYQSCDLLLAINQLTSEFNKELAPTVPSSYVPHGVDLANYKPIQTEDTEVFCRNRNIPTDKYKFLFDSVNIERKQLPAIIEAFKDHSKHNENAVLILKTNPTNRYGANVKELIKGIEDKIIIIKEYLSEEDMNLLHNSVDCLIHVPSMEGWGLSVTKALTLGKQVVYTETGGITEQIKCSENKNQTYAVHNLQSLLSSRQVPYIYQNIVDIKSLSDALDNAYKSHKNGNYDNTFSAEKMAKSIIEKIECLIKEWKSIPSISITKIDVK